MVVVWSANHFYYNGELFSCLLYSSLKAIICPPAKPGVAFSTTNSRTAHGSNSGPSYAPAICRFSIRFQLTNPYRSFTRNITKQIRTDK